MGIKAKIRFNSIEDLHIFMIWCRPLRSGHFQDGLVDVILEQVEQKLSQKLLKCHYEKKVSGSVSLTIAEVYALWYRVTEDLKPTEAYQNTLFLKAIYPLHKSIATYEHIRANRNPN